ncbi:MAG: ankyrin repeat domain-containing protein [Mycobacteriales bacterium]
MDEETVEFAHSLFDLAREGKAEELAAYVDAGIPVDLTNAKGDTLLLLAAYAPHADVVRALLERGADANRVNDRGQTPLAAAAFRSSAASVELLLAAGGDPLRGNPDALATARFFELPEMVALLTRG